MRRPGWGKHMRCGADQCRNGWSRIPIPRIALELVEFAAVRDAISRRELEAREPLERPLDVLVQHLVTLALGGGFFEKDARAEIGTTHAFRNLSTDEWNWVLDFVTRGGNSLRAYPQFRRVRQEGDFFIVDQPEIARFHRMGAGLSDGDSGSGARQRRKAKLGGPRRGARKASRAFVP